MAAAGRVGGVAAAQALITPRGFVPSGLVEPGDLVFGSSGWAETVAFTEVGWGPLFRVRFFDGTEVLCGADQLWAVTRPGDSRRGRRARRLSTVELTSEGM